LSICDAHPNSHNRQPYNENHQMERDEKLESDRGIQFQMNLMGMAEGTPLTWTNPNILVQNPGY
jgi:hypothetical protein